MITALLLWIPVWTVAQSHQEWTHNLGVYEVNIRQYTEEGTFAAFEEHLDRLEEMGVGILWLMPIHPIGEENRLGSLGSYYSVKDYRGVNPEFGTREDFEHLVGEIHDRGMYVMLDWVPNHTSWDNYLTEEHPEWYMTDDEGNFVPPPGTNWSDVIQLDHSRQGLLDYMIDAMLFWVEEYHVDGFRYDAVSHVLEDDFLDDLNNALKDVKPDLFLLAEHDDTKWHDLGFDMSFGWGLYGFGHGVLKRIADGTDDAHDLHDYMTSELNRFPPDAYRMYFTSNDDDVFVFTRAKEGDQVLVVYNLSDREQTVTLEASSDYTGQYREVFTDEIANITGGETLTLSAWDYYVYERIGDPTGAVYEDHPESCFLHQNYPNP